MRLIFAPTLAYMDIVCVSPWSVWKPWQLSHFVCNSTCGTTVSSRESVLAVQLLASVETNSTSLQKVSSALTSAFLAVYLAQLMHSKTLCWFTKITNRTKFTCACTVQSCSVDLTSVQMEPNTTVLGMHGVEMIGWVEPNWAIPFRTFAGFCSGKGKRKEKSQVMYIQSQKK